MTENSTQMLRHMLDERCVEWWPDKYYKETNTVWRADGMEWCASEQRDGKLLVGCTSLHHLTPEQAMAATAGAGTVDKAAERIEALAGLAREYLHRYGTFMSIAGEDATDEVIAIEQVINEVCGKTTERGE